MNLSSIRILLLSLPVVLPLCSQSPQVSGPSVLDNLRKLPLAFEENRGQAVPGVDFVAHGPGYRVALTEAGATIAMHAAPGKPPSVVHLQLLGALSHPRASAAQPLGAHVNYFLGNDPARWRTGIATFGRVEYSGVYRGIDLAYYGHQGRLEYDFIVAPGADPAAIRLAAAGARNVRLQRDGALAIETAGEDIRFAEPVAYQEIAGVRRPVDSRYVLAGRNIGFSVPSYNHRYPLIIDPSLVYSTYAGGSGYSSGTAIAIGPAGNAFVTGQTTDLDFPTVNPEQSFFAGYQAIFLLKMSTDGSSLVYSTYLGGSSGNDTSYSIAVDSSGSAYVAGQASSADFPVKHALYSVLNGGQDAFVTKFTPAGNALVYSTFLGGSGFEVAYGMAVDASHNVYLAGNTQSTDFPTTAGAYQTASTSGCSTFVTKINPSESALVWSTYFGEFCSPQQLRAIALDSQNAVYFTGWTAGALPVTPGAPQPAPAGGSDAFVAKLSPSGASLNYCTYLGGSLSEEATAIAVDSSGSAYVTGYTQSADLPVTASALQPASGGGLDAFLAKLNPAGTKWAYLTYLGGSRDDNATAIAVDSTGDAFVSGYTNSPNLPRVSALQPTYAGPQHILYRTTSKGASWTASDTGFNETSFYYGSLVVDPLNAAHLLAISGDGVLYSSTDSGAHWTANAGLSGVYLYSLAFSPLGGTVYASTFNSVYSSSDSGNTWTFAGYLEAGFSFLASLNMTVDPVTPTTLYAAGGSIYYYIQNLGKSTDGGVTWTAMNGLFENVGVSTIAISPKNDNTLYAGTTGGLYKSTDGGQTWNALNLAGLQNPTVTAVALDPSQPAVMYAAANGSVYKSTNAGTSWQLSSTGLTAYVYYLALAAPKPSQLYAGTTSGMFASSNSAASWTAAGFAGDTIWGIAVSPTQSSVAYASLLAPDSGFVAKVNPTGTGLVYSTYLGGGTSINAVALDKSGNAFVTGNADTLSYPVTPGAFQGAPGVQRTSAFVTEIASATPACSYSVAPASAFFYAAGGAANLVVVAPSGCAWTPTPSAPWITVTSGTGPGVSPLTITAAPNTGAARSGTVTIGTASFAVTEQASGCAASLSTNSLTFPQAGGSQNLNVIAPAGCQWVVTALPVFLTVTSGAAGTGNGTVKIEAAPNPFPQQRTGTFAVANVPAFATQTGTQP